MKLMRNIAIGVVLTLLVVVVGFMATFDANRFSPLITQAAREQGFAAQVGKIKLALWPDLGLTLEQIKVDSIEHPGPAPLVTVASAKLAIPIQPLLSGQLQVNEISLTNGVINLWESKSGDNNWTPAPAAPVEKSAKNEASNRVIAINKIKLEEIAVNWQEEKQSPLALNIKQGEIQRKALDLYLIAIAGQLNAQAKAPALAFAFEQELKKIDARWQLNAGKGKLGPVDGPQLLINYHLDTDAEFKKVAGAFEVAPFNPSSYLELVRIELADRSRMKSIAIRADFSWQPQLLQFNKGLLTLDDMPISWQLSQNSGRWQLGVKAAKINADAYMPPPNNAQAVPATDEQAANADLTGLPNIDVSLQVDELIIAKQSISDLNLKAAVEQRQITLAPFSARVYGGAINGRAEVNLAAKSVHLTSNIDAAGIALESLWKQANPQAQLQLTGAVNAKTQWQSTAPSLTSLAKQINGQVQFDGNAVRIAPLNITQQYCQIVSQATQWKKDSNEWPEFTQLQDLTGEITITPTRVEFMRLHSRVDKLQLDSEGVWERDTDAFRMRLPITLLQITSAEDAIKGCTIGSDYWVNRRLSLLECKGKLASLDAKRDCGIDRAGVAEVLKDYALYKIKKGEGINVDHIKEKAAEKKAELKEKIDANLDREQAKKLEDKLKKMFKRE
ncbi:MAG: AsmA family protein [Moraxellaceae bacterium]|nr:MAG: AsmA family protein [Moraxellaceae bacterium]